MQTARCFADYRKPLQSLPNNNYYNSERVACFNRPHISSDPYDEGILASRIVANAYIATGWYSLLMWDYYRSMPPNSGVLFSTAVRSRELSPDLLYPGDIDLLAIPYEDDGLILSRTLALEIKVIRATYANQKKSPNRFGFSQVRGLVDFGFPYVGVAHLIVADDGPQSEYVEYLAALCIKGKVVEINPTMADSLHVNLEERAYGRLKANCPDSRIGYFTECIYPGRIYVPYGQRCESFGYTPSCLDAIAQCYYRETATFLRLPRFEPDKSA